MKIKMLVIVSVILVVMIGGCDSYVGFDKETVEVMCWRESPFGEEQPETCNVFLDGKYSGSDIPEKTCCHWYADDGWYEVWCTQGESCDWNYLESYYACKIVE